MVRSRFREVVRRSIFILIALSLVCMTSIQTAMAAKSIGTPCTAADFVTNEDAHAPSHFELQDLHQSDPAPHDASAHQDDPSCCELSCVSFAVIALGNVDISTPTGEKHPFFVSNDVSDDAIFDLMRPPQA